MKTPHEPSKTKAGNPNPELAHSSCLLLSEGLLGAQHREQRSAFVANDLLDLPGLLRLPECHHQDFRSSAGLVWC